jgi:hypothetical protein
VTVGEVQRESNGDPYISWGWLAKAIAGMVIVGIPSMLFFLVSIVTTQERIETRQLVVIDRLAAVDVWKDLVDARLDFYRGPHDTQWAALVSRIDGLETHLAVVEAKVDFLRGPRDTAWKQVERITQGK